MYDYVMKQSIKLLFKTNQTEYAYKLHFKEEYKWLLKQKTDLVLLLFPIMS